MNAEHITIVDNRVAYRARLTQLALANPLNIPLIQKTILMRLYAHKGM
jgi:hypothetical protein